MTTAARHLLSAACLLLLSAGAVLAATPPAPPSAGPPYPSPVEDVFVYDYASILSPATEASATRTIVAIEQRVGAQIAVYTQYKPGATTESTEHDAMALMDQWGVGRAGFDDGLVILFNMTRRACQAGVTGNGQVQLYAGPGYAATFLSDRERQQIFDEQMVPHLRACDLDRALLVALDHIDQNATPEHARVLAAARIADAAIGLIGGPVVFLLLIGVAGRAWLRYGRDPVYLDSPSILMPAPPPDLTAASGAVVWEGRTTRRALTVALLDLASRGELSFRTERKRLREQAGIQIEAEPGSDPYTIRNRRRPISAGEGYVLERLRGLASKSGDMYIDPDGLQEFAVSVGKFNERIEKHVARQGWFREPPQKAVGRWTGRGTIALFIGIGIAVLGYNLPSWGVIIFGAAVGAAGLVMMVIAHVMPARTMAGAMIYAMLAAYRRTLQKTMEQARSMEQVVEDAHLDWLETPDQAIVWGVALGLHREVEDVLERSVEDARAATATAGGVYMPAWYSSSSASASGGARGLAPGLFSSGGAPNFGGMMAALGTIGSTSSGSGSGGSGSFGGGSSGGGGGGGGAGGGF
jgi:uncharacterized membrane protein YgcG